MRKIILSAMSAALACTGGFFASNAVAQHSINDLSPLERAYPVQGAFLGQGYDYVSGRWLSSLCVLGNGTSLPTQSSAANYKILEDKEQLFESMKASAEGGVDFGAAGASVKAEFAKSVTIDHVRRNVLANIEAMNGGQQMLPLTGKVSPQINPLLNQDITEDTKEGSKTAKFRTKCGDGYVAAIRHGVRYHLVFSYKMDAEEIQETLKIEASGKYGPAKAKASMEKIKKKTGSASDTEVSFVSSGGGKKELPVDAAQAIEWIKTSIDVSGEDVSPLEVVILPYSTLPDFPAKLRARELPPLGLRLLSTHYWRLLDLGALYTAAVNSPANYYRPFMSFEETSDTADNLKRAALCVPEILQYCASSGKCSVDEIAKWASKESRICKAVATPKDGDDDTTRRKKSAVARFVFGTQYLRNLAADKAQRSRNGDRSPSPFETKEIESPPVDGSSRTVAAGDEAWDRSPYDIFLQFLVRAPLKRDWNVARTALSPTDETQLILEYCKAQDMDCKKLTYPSFSTQKEQLNTDQKKLINESVAMYLARVKLAAIAYSMCDIDLAHPLCMTPNQLIGYVMDGNSFREVKTGDPGGFPVLATPSPPPPPPKKEPPFEPCSGRLCPPT